MTSAELHRQVARATGESLETVRRIGFFLAKSARAPASDDKAEGPLVLDWDELEAARVGTTDRESNPRWGR